MVERQSHDSATLVRVFHTSCAELSQVNSFARSKPALLKVSRKEEFSRLNSTPCAIDSTFRGSTRSAASPTTSGMAVEYDVTTGVPQAIASKGGDPNPS